MNKLTHPLHLLWLFYCIAMYFIDLLITYPRIPVHIMLLSIYSVRGQNPYLFHPVAANILSSVTSPVRSFECFKTDFEMLLTVMPKAGFEPAISIEM